MTTAFHKYLIMNTLNFPILSVAIFLPLAGAILLLFMRGERSIKVTALITAIINFPLSLFLFSRFDVGADRFQFGEFIPWVPSYNINYILGIDGITIFLILLTTLLAPLCILCSWTAIERRVKEFMFCLLIMETAMIGVFCALDFILFYVFWEAMLIPMYFLIGIWGGRRRIYASVKFFIYTMAGSLLMLAAILWLYFDHQGRTGVYTFALSAYGNSAAGGTGMLLFLAFALAFAIKVPLWPFHTWLPDAHVEAPTAGSVILAGVLLKMGTYGLLRFAFPLFPQAAMQFAPVLAVLAVIGIVYGALVAMVQPDMKKLVAYSSVSHLGFVVLGITAMNLQGVQGAVYQMLNHGVSTGALFLIVGMLSDRRHTRLIAEFGGLKHVMPRLVAAFFVITLSSIGLPGLNGFVGEFLILLGAFAWNPWLAAVAASGVILSAVYMLWMFQRVNYGPVTNPKNEGLPDMDRREGWVLVPAIAMAVFMGVAPWVFLNPMKPAVERIVLRMAEAEPMRVVHIEKGPGPISVSAPSAAPGVAGVEKGPGPISASATSDAPVVAEVAAGAVPVYPR